MVAARKRWCAVLSAVLAVELLAVTAFFPASVFTSPSAAADDKKPAEPDVAAPISYNRQVLPILREHCHGCHQPALRKGEFEMTGFASLLKGGETGDAAIVPGNPDNSNLVAQITPKGGKVEMPKDKPPLADAQVKLIRQWIAEGAKDDTPAMARTLVDADHPPKYVLPSVVSSLDYSPDGKRLAVSGYHEVLLHDVDKLMAAGETKSLVARLVGLSERIESAMFSPDGKQLVVTGGQPGRTGEVQIWDVATGKISLSVPVTYDTVYGGCWSPDGKLVAFGCSDNTVRAIDPTTGKQVFFNGAHNDWVLDAVFSVKSDHLITVSRDMSMKLFEVGTQRFVDNITSITPGALKGGLASVDRHPTKDELLCGGSDGEPKLYKMIRTQARQIGDDFNLLRKFPAMPGRVYTVRFSRDGNRIVAGSSLNGTGEVHVFDANNASLVAKMAEQGGGVFAATFSPDGKTVASGGFDGFVRLNDAVTGKLVRKFIPAPLDPVPLDAAATSTGAEKTSN
jgi:WD40 repeat protein